MGTLGPPDDVVITGVAWATPLGTGLDQVWRRLVAGERGLRTLPAPHPLSCDLAGVAGSVDPSLPPTDRLVALTTDTLTRACRDAGLAPDDPDTRLVLGTSFGAVLDDARADPLDTWARTAAGVLGHPHPPVCVSTACSAGSDALAVAAELVRAGATPIAVAGGADTVTLAKRLGHSALGTMSSRAARPFDAEHDGMTLGEGAAFLVLESAASARRRGATVRARLCGAGAANEAAGLTAPDETADGLVLAVRRCLAAAGREASEVGVISAHATGTARNDAVECRGLGRLFGAVPQPPVVFGTKGALGHSLGATGAIEAVSVVLALAARVAPPTAGLGSPMPGFPLPLTVGGPLPIHGRLGLSLTLGFGGFTTCLLLEGPG
ncbi:MAG: beta-ketoacyl-[acyl-carrier-protein] synthase family protein [Actinobacteria bacterium]|nr:beta-ketoacyl-[acyl-carrier-protein] synthase family protein [Actinomycetota bacterium]